MMKIVVKKFKLCQIQFNLNIFFIADDDEEDEMEEEEENEEEEEPEPVQKGSVKKVKGPMNKGGKAAEGNPAECQQQ